MKCAAENRAAGSQIGAHPALKALCAERQCLSIGNSLYNERKEKVERTGRKLFATRLFILFDTQSYGSAELLISALSGQLVFTCPVIRQTRT
jgi:hypothetical protein